MARMLERLWDGPDAGDNQGPAALLAEQVRPHQPRPRLPRRAGGAKRPPLRSGQATADTLFGPDWGLLMELCDKVNLEVQTCVAPPRGRRVPPREGFLLTAAPPPPSHGKDAAKALRKRLEKGSPKGQLLALTVRAARPPHAQRPLTRACPLRLPGARGDGEELRPPLPRDCGAAGGAERDGQGGCQPAGALLRRRDAARLSRPSPPPSHVFLPSLTRR